MRRLRQMSRVDAAAALDHATLLDGRHESIMTLPDGRRAIRMYASGGALVAEGEAEDLASALEFIRHEWEQRGFQQR